jgi:hypothetical protein
MLNRKFLSSILAIFLSFPFLTFAMGAGFEMGATSYMLYFTQKNNTLYQSSSPGYDIIQDAYIETVKRGDGVFYLEIVNMAGNIVSRVDFLGAGKSGSSLNIRAPYFADAKLANIYDSSGKKILSVDLSGSSICNGNGRCDAQFGESASVCPSECGSAAVAPIEPPVTPPAPVVVEPTVGTSPEQPSLPVEPQTPPVVTNTTQNDGISGLPRTAVMVLAGALVLAAASFILLKKRQQGDGE